MAQENPTRTSPSLETWGPAPTAHGQPSLRRNLSWAVLGNGVYSACQWGLLAGLAKFGSSEMLGELVLGIAVTAPVIEFSGMNLHVALATDAGEQYRFGEYLALRLATVVLALAAILAVALRAGYGGEELLVIAGMGLAKAVEAFSLLCYGLFQQHEQLAPMARSQIVRGLLSLLSVVAVVAATGRVGPAVLAMALVWLAVLVGHDLRHAVGLLGGSISQLRLCWEWKRLAALLWLVLPLGLAVGIDCLNVNLPRYFVEHWLGRKALGVFAAIAYLGVAGRMFYPPLLKAVVPRLSRYCVQGRLGCYLRLMGKLLVVSAAVGCAAVGLAAVLGRLLLTILYTAEYAEYTALFTWLTAAVALRFQAMVLVASLQAMRRFKTITPVALASCLVLALALAGWVPKYGLLGAAWATLASAAVEFLLFGALNVALLAQSSCKQPLGNNRQSLAARTSVPSVMEVNRLSASLSPLPEATECGPAAGRHFAPGAAAQRAEAT